MELLKNKKILFATLALVGAIILVVFSSFLKKPSELSTSPTTIPTPTPIPLPPTAFRDLSIESVTPEDLSSSTSLFASISASFSRPLSDAEKERVFITLDPSVDGSISWSGTNDTFIFTPGRFNTATLYKVVLNYGALTKSWSFTTVSDANISIEDQNSIQLQSDDQFGAWQSKLYESYPWYDNFPLQTSDYFTYFDIDTKQFVSDIYGDPKNTQRIDVIKLEVLQQVQSFGININNYKFVWNTTPEF